MIEQHIYIFFNDKYFIMINNDFFNNKKSKIYKFNND